jgi:hypothetical protein
MVRQLLPDRENQVRVDLMVEKAIDLENAAP